MSVAVKLSTPLIDAARAESRISARSMTQQVEHWARIGRAVERAGLIDGRRLRAALAAELEFDALGPEERAATLAVLEQVAYPRGGHAGLAAELEGRGLLAADGDVEPWPTAG